MKGTRQTEYTTGRGISPALLGTLGAHGTLNQNMTGSNRANEDVYAIILVLVTDTPAFLPALKHDDEESGTKED